MQSLSTPLRNKLETTVKTARDVAEDGESVAAPGEIELNSLPTTQKPSRISVIRPDAN